VLVSDVVNSNWRRAASSPTAPATAAARSYYARCLGPRSTASSTASSPCAGPQPAGRRSPRGPGARSTTGADAWDAYGAGLPTSRCLRSAGPVFVDCGERFGLPGAVALLPARDVATGGRWTGDEYVLEMSGRVVDNALGLEPSTRDDDGRAAVHRAGPLVALAPGPQRRFTAKITVQPAGPPSEGTGT